MALNVGSNFSGYQPGSGPPGIATGKSDDGKQYWPLSKCKAAYLSYLDSKREEIDEQQQARRYRHGAHWTVDQVNVLNRRKQPVVTYNRIGRKIDGIVGLVERLRQDPKAYPRTPQHQQGADLATAALRFLIDENDWKAKKPVVSDIAATDGIGGIELELKPSDTTQPGVNPGQPDMDVDFNVVDIEGFFYDPRSFKHDFSDARFMGLGKWIDVDQLKEKFPDQANDIEASVDRGNELTSDSDRDNRWFYTSGEFRRVRLVDIWYQHRGKWCWALFTGGMTIMEGISPFLDEKDETFCKYIMFSAAVDHDGDRYGFPRNLKSAQDEINQRRSKGLHELNSRRIRSNKSAVADTDVERLRREAARPDGIVLSNTANTDDIQFDDAAKQINVMGQLEFLREAKAEIENFGPNPAVLGDSGIKNQSGRAIALLQQAGIAELGPYMLNLRGWTLRVYRALFHVAQRYWTNERWIRVTDDQGLIQFVQINALQVDPMTGAPTIANAIGQLDVDIILDEGPDTITMMQDTYDAIAQALPSVAPMLSPAKASAVLDVLIETSPLPADVKKKFRDAGAQDQQQGPPPEVQAQMAKMQMEQQHDQAKLQLKAQEAQADMQIKREGAMLDAQLEREKTMAGIERDRMKAAADMQIAREKAGAEIEIRRASAAADANRKDREVGNGKAAA